MKRFPPRQSPSPSKDHSHRCQALSISGHFRHDPFGQYKIEVSYQPCHSMLELSSFPELISNNLEEIWLVDIFKKRYIFLIVAT